MWDEGVSGDGESGGVTTQKSCYESEVGVEDRE